MWEKIKLQFTDEEVVKLEDLSRGVNETNSFFPKIELHHSDCTGKGPANIGIIREGHEMIHRDNADAIFKIEGIKSRGFYGDGFTRKLGNKFYGKAPVSGDVDFEFSILGSAPLTSISKPTLVQSKLSDVNRSTYTGKNIPDLLESMGIGSTSKIDSNSVHLGLLEPSQKKSANYLLNMDSLLSSFIPEKTNVGSIINSSVTNKDEKEFLYNGFKSSKFDFPNFITSDILNTAKPIVPEVPYELFEETFNYKANQNHWNGGFVWYLNNKDSLKESSLLSSNPFLPSLPPLFKNEDPYMSQVRLGESIVKSIEAIIQARTACFNITQKSEMAIRREIADKAMNAVYANSPAPLVSPPPLDTGGWGMP